MNENQNVFFRYEIKYIVSPAQRAALEELIRASMRPDSHGESTVCSLYLDTPDRLLIRRCLLRPQYKQKLRLRSYGPARPDDTVFLELKEKYGELSYKRRIALPEREAASFANGGPALPESGQISRELNYARAALPGLAPSMHISCSRAAFFSSRAGEDIRITFDRDILWRDERLTLASGADGEPLLPKGHSLMEVKTASAVPLWLTRKLSLMGLYSTSFSKYGLAYTELLNRERGGVVCA